MGTCNLFIRVVEGLDLVTEEGVAGEVLRLLLDVVGLFLAFFDSLSLIVEKLKEDSSESFNLVESACGTDFGILRHINVFSLLYCAVKL